MMASTSPSINYVVVAAAILLLPLLTLLPFTDFFLPPPRQSIPLVIGIFSARDHFDHRSAIRRTWLYDLKRSFDGSGIKVLVKFILGTRSCPLHPTDSFGGCRPRLSSSSVFHRPLFAVHREEEEKVDSSSSQLFCPRDAFFEIRVDFRVHEGILVDRIGILELPDVRLRLTLVDSATGNVLISVHDFDKSTETFKGFRYISISPFALKSDFQGYFALSAVEGDHAVCFPWSPHFPRRRWRRFTFQSANGTVFSFTRVAVRDADGFDEVATSFLGEADGADAFPVSFRFKIDAEALDQRLEDAASRSEIRRAELDDETKRIAKESAEFDDLLEVELLDTYARLPDKLLATASRLSSEFDVGFFLKVDDDVFLRVDALRRLLADYELLEAAYAAAAPHRLWLGRFRRDWAVMRHGKWAESFYQGNGYPPFACGATYGVSGDALAWLASNARSLRRYQGEDVSMGFWMAAYGAEVTDDPRFACGADDGSSGAVNEAELTPAGIVRAHKNAAAAKELESKMVRRPQLVDN